MRPLQHALLGAECQVQHWKEGGHDKLCKKIKKRGGAEQYNANKKYAEAVAVAAEACAEDTKGQTCFICTQALHWKTKEGLVRGCSCRGTAGFAHVSCLAEQAKILFAEAEDNNLGDKVMNEWFSRWYTCSLCEQDHHGVVRCALGWACWKTHVGRREADQVRMHGDERGWTRFARGRTSRGRGVRQRDRVGYAAAPWRIRRTAYSRAGQSCDYVSSMGRLEEAMRSARCILWTVEALWRGT